MNRQKLQLSLNDWSNNPKFQSRYIMLKNILNLEGAQELSREQQQSIKGGIACSEDFPCKKGSHCVYGDDSTEGRCVLN
jgi:hypothetical protein